MFHDCFDNIDCVEVSGFDDHFIARKSVIFVVTSTLSSHCSRAPVLSDRLMRSMYSCVRVLIDFRQTDTSEGVFW